MAIVKTTQAGIGMTSLRTRERMLVRLREQGIKDEVVLSAISSIPRHIFVDEALSIRAYEDVYCQLVLVRQSLNLILLHA